MQKTEFDMSRNHRAALAGVIAATALAATACSNEAQEPEVSEPSFSAVETTSSQATTSAETTTSEATSSETSSAETSSTTSAKQEGSGSFNDELDNGDGTYLLSTQPPGGGTARDVKATYTNLPEQGFSSVEVIAPASYMNGNMQYVLAAGYDSNFAKELELTLNAVDLDKRELGSNDTCRIDMELLDEHGQPMTLASEDSVRGGCDAVFAWDLDFTGEYTMVAKVYQPGFEPLVIKQPIRIFD